MRHLAWGLALATLLPAAEAQSLAIRLPATDAIEVRRVYNTDRGQSGPGNMLYGPGAVGAIVGLIAHAAVVDGMRESARRRSEADSDRVLQPYRPALDGITNTSLMREALELANLPQPVQLVPAHDPADADWQMNLAPVFWLTTDERAILLEVAIAVRKPGSPSPLWQNKMWLVSRKLPDADLSPRDVWIANEGQRLRRTGATLLALAYELSVEQTRQVDIADAGLARPQRTHRYWEGGQRRAERAELLARNDCGRALLRNLRGELMSVPLIEEDEDAEKAVDSLSPACQR